MKWWQNLLLWTLLFAVGGTFLIVLPMLAYTKQLPVEDFIRIGALVVSWPVAAIVITFFFVRQFHDAIDVFLRNVASMKFPGGLELQRQQPPQTETSEEGEVTGSPSVSEPAEEIVEQVSGLSAQERSVLQSNLENAFAWVRYWKFTYLNIFFIEMTKNVLDWIANNPNNRQMIDLIYMSTIPDPNQRNTILNVLLQYGMISETNGRLQVTPEGYDFLRFIGRRT